MKVKNLIIFLLVMGVVGLSVFLFVQEAKYSKGYDELKNENSSLEEEIETLENEKDFLTDKVNDLKLEIKELKSLIPKEEEQEEEQEEENDDTGEAVAPTETVSRSEQAYEAPVVEEVVVVEEPVVEAPVVEEPVVVETPATSYNYSFVASVTMYTLDPAECGKYPGDPGYGITASGAYVQEWYTVAAGPSIPFGTRVYIPYFADYPNGGIFVVQDRGGAIGDGNIDIYVYDKATALNFGRQALEVQVLD